MGIFKYLCKVLQNKDGVYERENQILKEACWFLITFLVCVIMFIFPLLRIIMKWLAYFAFGSFGVFMLCSSINSVLEIFKSFRYAKRLEKLGTSVEEEEMARRALCEMEGDQGLASE